MKDPVYTLKEAIELSKQRIEDIQKKEKHDRNRLMSDICQWIDCLEQTK